MKSTVLMLIAVLIGILVLVGMTNGCGSDLVFGAESNEKITLEEIIIEDLREPVSAVLEKGMADVPIVEIPLLPVMHLWGVATITHYCNCSACCGQWAGGGTASGTVPTAGRTVAADLPFGTRLLINGNEYIVEDRGVSGCWVDIYCDSHAEALARGMYSTEVWIIDDN